MMDPWICGTYTYPDLAHSRRMNSGVDFRTQCEINRVTSDSTYKAIPYLSPKT